MQFKQAHWPGLNDGKLTRSGHFDEIYIQSAAGDDGTALGAGLYRAAQAGEVVNKRFSTSFYGPAHVDGTASS